jgi:hypothetical protein
VGEINAFIRKRELELPSLLLLGLPEEEKQKTNLCFHFAD